MATGNPIAAFGRGGLNTLSGIGSAGIFLIHAITQIFSRPFRLRRYIQEIEFLGAKSFLIVFVTAIFTGMVLALQGYYTLSGFGAEALLGVAVSQSIIRELGPVLCALMVAGRAGSATAAEIGIMKITDQVPALEMMAIDPIAFIISPKVLAGIISVPILTGFFDLIGIGGGYLVGVNLLGVNEGAFIGNMVSTVTAHDIWGGFLKSVFFGLIIAWVATFKGYTAKATTEGVAAATTSTVVLSSVLILVVDYILTSMLL